VSPNKPGHIPTGGANKKTVRLKRGKRIIQHKGGLEKRSGDQRTQFAKVIEKRKKGYEKKKKKKKKKP